MYKYPRFIFLAVFLSSISFTGLVYAEQAPRSSLEMLEKQVQETVPVFITTTLPAATENHHYTAKIVAKMQGTESALKPLSYQLLSGPIGFKLDENGKISWSPDFEAAGEHSIKVSVTDGESTTEKTFTLTVANNNRLPIWETKIVKDAKEGENYRENLRAHDPDGSELSYMLQQGPQGLTLTTDGTLDWKPDFFTAGKHTIKVSVSDGEAAVSNTFKLHVENSNRLPEWQTQTLGKAAEGQAWKLQLLVNDVDKEELQYIIDQAPEGMKVNKQGLLNWVPDYTTAGNYTIKLSVADAYSSVSKTFSLTVDNTNRPPIIHGNLSAKLHEAAIYSATIEASDPDGDSLLYKITDQPEGVSLKKNVIRWLPSYEQAGEYTFIVTVSDAELSAEQQVIWHVKNTNRLPEWKTSNLPKAKENRAYKVQLEAIDADKTPLSYKLRSAPKGMIVNEVSGELTWMPDFEASGTYHIEISVSDGEDSVSITLPLVVENTNRAPTFASTPNVQAVETLEYRYQVSVADADNEPLSLKILKAPKAMMLINNELIWTPTYEQAGEYDIELELADAEIEVQQKFKLIVENTNRPPVFTPLDDDKKQLAENALWKTKIQALDADRQVVELTLDEAPEGLNFNNNTLSWKPTFEQAGEHKIVLSATDGESQVQYDVVLRVNNVNRLPAFTSQPVLSAKETEAYQYVIQGADPDGTPLVFSMLQSPVGMILENNTLFWTPDYEQSGKHQVTLQVTDGEDVVEQSFVINVENTNRAPIFKTAAQTAAKEDSPYSYEIDVTDPDHTSVELSLIQSPDGLKLKKNALSWQPDFESAGTYPIIVEASDGETVTQQAFNLTVENTNRLPVIISKPVLSAIESFPYSYTVKAEDADRQPLTMRLISAPAGMVMNNDLIEWIPAYDQQGTQDVVVEVSDGEDNVQQLFTIKVANTNREPNISSIDDMTIIAGDNFKYQVQASDDDGDPVQVRVESGPRNMTVKSGVLMWNTSKRDIGSYTVIISASDGDLQSRTHFEINVLQRSE